MNIRNFIIYISATFFAIAVQTATAQQPVPKSIIVKFKTATTIDSPSDSLRRMLSIISPKRLTDARIISVVSHGNLQSLHSQNGLDRIVVLPIANGVAAMAATTMLQKFVEIEYCEPNYIYHINAIQPPNDSLYSKQWAHRAMSVPDAWSVTQGDSSVHIGFVDTGVEWDHPDLAGQFAVNPAEDINHNGLFDAWSSSVKDVDAYGDSVYGDLDGVDEDGNGYVDDVIGYDFVDQESVNFGDALGRDPIPQDEGPFSHGTAVAGVIAAKVNNKIGVAGIAPKCRLVALRAFDATGNAESDDIASAIIYAADNGVRIINLSFGDITPSMLQRDAIRYATSKGVLVVASSGNDGSDARHYPSDFDECLSVGMASLNNLNHEVLDPQSSYGEGLDLIAPGGNILTTAGDGLYQYISGTSFSSPATAAAAALLLSHNPLLTNTELRSILESTTDYISSSGYDHTHANGRVNVGRAVHFRGSASVKIISPNTDDLITTDSIVSIKGSAASTLFVSYSMWFVAGLNPDRDSSIYFQHHSQNLITDSSTSQVLAGTLGVWNTSGLPDGIYTLGLVVTTSDARMVEERMTVYLKRRGPLAMMMSVDTMYNNNRRALLIRARSDTITRSTLYYKNSNSNTWFAKNDDNFTHGHFFLLTPDEATNGIPLDLKVVMRSTGGDSVTSSAVAAIPDQAINQDGFVEKNYSLPSGYLLDSVFSAPTGNIVLESIAPAGSDFGLVEAFKFDSNIKQFVVADSLPISGLPRAIGNITGGSAPNFLIGGAFNTIFIYRPNTEHPVFGDLIFSDTTTSSLYSTTLADVDGDGKDELVGLATIQTSGILTNQYEVDKISSGVRTKLGILPNPTAPPLHFGTNTYTIPDTKSLNVTSSKAKNLAILDDDADLLVYKFDPASGDGFDTIFTKTNDGYTEGRNFAVGDFNGDGLPDVAYAYHTNYDVNSDNEYDPLYWTLNVLFNNGSGSFTLAYTDKFYNAKSQSPYRSSLGAIRDVSGSNGNDLALSFFPNFYLLHFDATSNSMKPIWQYPVANSPAGALAFDFDGNGKLEFGFDAGDSIRFFENVNNYNTQTPPPAGLSVAPLDTNRADLTWASVAKSSMYYILRADDSPSAQYDLIDSTTNTIYTDTSVSNYSTYIYSVQAFSQSYTIPLSQPALGIAAFIHPKPYFSFVSATRTSVRLQSNQPLSTAGLSGGEFAEDDSLPVSTAIIASDSAIVLTLYSIPASNTQHSISLRSTEVRDIWNSPFDTSRKVFWTPPIVSSTPSFYIARWQFENSSLIHIEFSMKPDDNALLVQNYTLTPFGSLTKAFRDTSNDSAIYLSLASGTALAPIGNSYVLCAENITSNGIALETSGNCIGETPTASSLDHLFIYPNPILSSDMTATFAGLTAQATISIYTENMRFLKRLSTSVATGGVEWDLRDETGSMLPSGIYIYHVSGKDNNGNDVPAREAKFVIVRN